MRVHKIGFSHAGKHIPELRSALNLSYAVEIIDIGRVLQDVRSELFTQTFAHPGEGKTFWIGDLLLTGKTCTAYNLALSWLLLGEIRDDFSPSVVILEPESEVDWQYESISSEIDKALPAASRNTETLVIIDQVEHGLGLHQELSSLLEQLAKPHAHYHLILLYTYGFTLSNTQNNQLDNWLNDPNRKLESYDHLTYSQQDIQLLLHLRTQWVAQESPARPRQIKVVHQNNGKQSHILGFDTGAGDYEQIRSHRSMRQLSNLPDVRALIWIFEKLQSLYIIQRPGFLLATQRQQPVHVSKRLLQIHFSSLVTDDLARFEAALRALSASGFMQLSDYALWISDLLVQSSPQLLTVINDPVLLAVEDLINGSPYDYYQLGIAHLHHQSSAVALEALAKCIGTEWEDTSVNHLADHLTYGLFSSRKPVENCGKQLAERISALFEDHSLPDLEQLVLSRVARRLRLNFLPANLADQLADWQSICDRSLTFKQTLHGLVIVQSLLNAQTGEEFLEKLAAIQTASDSSESSNPDGRLLQQLVSYIHYVHPTQITGKEVVNQVFQLLSGQLPPVLDGMPVQFGDVHDQVKWTYTLRIAHYILTSKDLTDKTDYPVWIAHWARALPAITSPDAQNHGILIAWLAGLLREFANNPGWLRDVLTNFQDRKNLWLKLWLQMTIINLLGNLNEPEKVQAPDLDVFLAEVVDFCDEMLGGDFFFYHQFLYLGVYIAFLEKYLEHVSAFSWAHYIKTHHAHIQALLETYLDKLFVFQSCTREFDFDECLDTLRNYDFFPDSTSSLADNVRYTYLLLLVGASSDASYSDTLKQEYDFVAAHFETSDLSERIQSLGQSVQLVVADGDDQAREKLRQSFVERSPWQGILTLIENNKIQQAMELLAVELSRDQLNPQIWYLLGLCYSNLCDHLRSIESFRRAILLFPRFVDAYLSVATIYRNLGHRKAEQDILNDVFVLYPNHFDVCNRLGEFQALEDNHEQAIQFFQKALDLQCAEPLEEKRLYMSIAFHQEMLGETRLALANYFRAIAIHPFDSKLLIETIKLIRKLGEQDDLEFRGRKLDQDQVCVNLIGYNEKRSTKPEDHFNLIAPIFFSGDIDGGWKKLNHLSRQYGFTRDKDLVIVDVLKMAGFNQTANFYQGTYLCDKEQYEDAIEVLDPFVEKYPYDSEGHYQLARSYVGLGQIQNKLRLDLANASRQIESALYHAISAYFYGKCDEEIYTLLAAIYQTMAESEISYSEIAQKNLLMAYLYNMNPICLVNIAKIRFLQLKQDLPSAFQDMKDWLAVLNEQIFDWAIKIGKDTQKPPTLRIGFARRTNNSVHVLESKLAILYLDVICSLKQSLSEDDREAAQRTFQGLFEQGESLFEAGCSHIRNDYTLYARFGDLYWEWQELDLPYAVKELRIKAAITHWQQALSLLHEHRPPRIDRTIREELEIAIGKGRKRLRQFSFEEDPLA